VPVPGFVFTNTSSPTFDIVGYPISLQITDASNTPSTYTVVSAPSNVSIFAGRIADTGVDPVPIMAEAVELCRRNPNQELIWASPRELLNIVQAGEIGCHIITVTPDILKKLPLIGKDLGEYSLDTVKMFHGDAMAAGFRL